MADETLPKKRTPRKTAAINQVDEKAAALRVRTSRKSAPAGATSSADEPVSNSIAKPRSRDGKKSDLRSTRMSETVTADAGSAAIAKKPASGTTTKSTSAMTAASSNPLLNARAKHAAMRRGSRVSGNATPAEGWRLWLVRVERWLERADPYLRLCRLDRPIGFLLLLWPTWWGLWAAAEGFPPWGPLVIFTLGVIVMRSAGCVINDYADRWLDPQVARTRTRPLAAGKVTPKQALALFLGLLTTALVLVLFTNALTMKLAVVGAVLAATYPFLKRYTHLPQIYLGVAFGWAIPMAFAAVLGEVPRLAWLLFLATILWSTAYDTLYAMVDRDDDIKAGAKSTAILFGDIDLIAVGLLHGTFLLTMLFVGQRLALNWPYWVGLAMAACLCALQLWRARRRDREGCFRAFVDNNWVGLTLFAGLAVSLAMK